MTQGSSKSYITTYALFMLACSASVVQAVRPPERTVNGAFTEVKGIPVLRVWGEPHERGYAHGFLLGDKIVPLLDGLIGTNEFGGNAEGYDRRILPLLRRMKIDPPYEAELRGLLAGIEARAGGPVEVPRLRRSLRYDDLAALNCLADFMPTGCSSFAAWGRMTQGGATVAGRNLDYPTVAGLFGTQIVIVNAPADDAKSLGWVSISWPGLTGCLTGINAAGVMVSMHNAEGHPPTVDSGFTPRVFTFREAIESAQPETAFEDVARVLRKHVCAVGNNVLVTRPHAGEGTAAVVFEYDGHLTNNQGVTIRRPQNEEDFIACTNDYRARAEPGSCDRYAKLTTVLERIAGSGGKRHVTTKRSWKMLRSVVVPWNTTYYSAVFEPNRGLIHLAFAIDGKDAPLCRSATLNVSELLEMPDR